MKITVGADPEFFLYDVRKEEIVPAIGYSEGTKEKPESMGGGFHVQVDGLALEYNIPPVACDLNTYVPGNFEKTFAAHINAGLSMSLTTAMNHSKNTDIAYDSRSFIKFTKEKFKTFPKEALIQGCDPDWNAWTGGINEAPPEDITARAAGGHIHVGWGEGFDVESGEHMEMCSQLVRQIDFALGLPSVLSDREGRSRRDLYGKAGAFRPKPYGLEYRSLSNYFIFSKGRSSKVASNLIKGLKDFLDGRIYEEFHGDIQNIINNSDVEMAREKVRSLGLLA